MATGILNEHTSYDSVATPLARSMFIGGEHQSKELLHTGTPLFRFTRGGGGTCEWWMLFHSFVLKNRQVVPGFADYLRHSGSRLDVNGRFVPKGDATLGCADPGSRIELVRLNRSVYAFAGPATPQHLDPCEPGLALVGGEFRVWIPGLKPLMINRIAVPAEFVLLPEEQESGDPEVDPAVPGGALALPGPVESE